MRRTGSDTLSGGRPGHTHLFREVGVAVSPPTFLLHMWICYVDEAGCTGVLPAAISDIQPVFVIAGIMVDQTRMPELTFDFLRLKQQFFPGAILPSGLAPSRFFDWAIFEVKGAEVRRMLADSSSTRRHHAGGFLGKLIELMRKHHVRLTGRLIAKGIGVPMTGAAIYSSAIQDICSTFNHFLTAAHTDGIIIADSRNKEQNALISHSSPPRWERRPRQSRNKEQNALISHSVFTQKFKSSGDDYGRILEMPTFGHSENHAGIQVADLLCSALLFPMAIDAFCEGHLTSCHVRVGRYRVLRTRFGADIRHFQHRYQQPGNGFWRGGIRVENRLTAVPGADLFRV